MHNLSVSGVLGINFVDGDVVKLGYAEENQRVLPSVFMPPLYIYFIYLIKILFSNLFNIGNVIIIFQIIISLFSILVFFKILKNFYSLKFSLLFSFIYSVIPINIYASVQISSLTLQIFLIIIYLYTFYNCLDNKNYFNLVKFSIIGGFLILMRGEFFIFHILTYLYLVLRKKVHLKEVIVFLFFSLAIVSPYLIRNYLIFSEIVLTKSFGYNLLKGNNPETTIEGNAIYIEKEFREKIKLIEINDKYEINVDNLYKNAALEYIKKNPISFFEKYFLKVFSFLFIDLESTYPNYYSLPHIIPKIILAVLSFFSALIFLNNKNFFNYLSLFYFSNAMFFSIFFILPRYSVMFIPVQLLLIANCIHNFFLKKIKKNYS